LPVRAIATFGGSPPSLRVGCAVLPWMASPARGGPTSAGPCTYSCPDLLRVVAFWLRFRRLCGSLPHASSHMWRLPWEKPKFTSSRLRMVFANTVSHLGVAPPVGRYWTLHCVRAGAASETSALGLSLPKIRAFGGWGLRSLVPERRYINPMCPASQSGHRFFGWMTASAALESSSH
jgi:hypothetical protein